MAQTVHSLPQSPRYLAIVGQLITIYQKQLLKLFRKYPLQISPDFQTTFSSTLQLLKITQTQKAIQNPISSLCTTMQSFFIHPVRPNRTSMQQRKSLKSQAIQRKFRMTGALPHKDQSIIAEQAQYNDIIQSYRIQQEIVPRMRMKWMVLRIGEHAHQVREDTIGSNNINMLSYTIPEIENSIRRLSVRKSPRSVKERELEMYRSLDSRSLRKKFITRLI